MCALLTGTYMLVAACILWFISRRLHRRHHPLRPKSATQKKRTPVSVAFLPPLERHEEAGELRCTQRPGCTHVCTPEWTGASGWSAGITVRANSRPKQPRTTRRHLPATRDGHVARKDRGPIASQRTKGRANSRHLSAFKQLARERTATSAANDGARERSSSISS